MPRQHEQRVTPTLPDQADAGFQVETVLSRPTRSPRAVVIRAPAGSVARRLPRVTRLMALAIKFQDMVDRGEVRDYAELASLGYVTRARITQIMNLLLLAPDIQESLVCGDIGSDVFERDLRAMASTVLWAAQRRLFSRNAN